MVEIITLSKEDTLQRHFGQLKEVYKEFFKSTVSGCLDSQEDLKNRLISKNSIEHWFLAFDDGKIVGFSLFGHGLPKGKLGWFDVFTLPGYEQNGTPLLKLVIRNAHENTIEKLWISSYSEQTWGLVESLGGKAMNTSVERILNMENYDWSVVNNWLAINNNDWVIKRYDSISEELVDEIADLSFDTLNEVRAMDGFPADSDKGMHVEWLKNMDISFKDEGLNYICFTISQKNAGVLGFVEGSISQAVPDFFLQRLVAVKKDQRGKGIGKHLKALMLDHLRTSHPEVVKIKTTNNTNNHSAIALNEKLGFKIIGAYKEYEIDVDKTVRFL